MLSATARSPLNMEHEQAITQHHLCTLFLESGHWSKAERQTLETIDSPASLALLQGDAKTRLLLQMGNGQQTRPTVPRRVHLGELMGLVTETRVTQKAVSPSEPSPAWPVAQSAGTLCTTCRQRSRSEARGLLAPTDVSANSQVTLFPPDLEQSDFRVKVNNSFFFPSTINDTLGIHQWSRLNQYSSSNTCTHEDNKTPRIQCMNS